MRALVCSISTPLLCFGEVLFRAPILLVALFYCSPMLSPTDPAVEFNHSFGIVSFPFSSIVEVLLSALPLGQCAHPKEL